jgi:2-oxo-4-hydroxy-4-carboxy--5-ureidoimidazoline (OHCU) decarboxylase
MSLPPITALSSSPAQIQTVLDHLFEPCPTLYTLVASHLPRSFASYDEFADFVADLLFALDDQDRLLDVLGAHPRLGAADGGEEAERLERLNDEYERAFPGKFCHGWVRE